MSDMASSNNDNKLSYVIDRLRGINTSENAPTDSSSFPSNSSYLTECIQQSQQKFEQNIVDLIKIHKFLKISSKRATESTDSGLSQLHSKIDQLLNSLDGRLGNMIEEYTVILQEELENNKRRLFSEKSDTAAIRREAGIFRVIKLFAEEMSFSSQSKVTMTFLNPSSTQYEKCEKAFTENIHPDLHRRGYSNFQVFQIIHLQNKHLSKLLQDSLESVSLNGRVKGVFCLLPFDFIRHFASFGLYMQEYHNSLPSAKDMISNWYTNPWHGHVEADLTAIPRDIIEEIRNQPPRGTLKFSNCSTPASTREINMLQKGNILCVALCRVLISNALVIQEDITDEDVAKARAENYDVVYSSGRGEYCLLNPDKVLPEFFIFVRLGGDASTGTSESAESDSSVNGTSKGEQAKSDRREVLAKKQGVIARVHDLLKSSVSSLSDELVHQFNQLDINSESK